MWFLCRSLVWCLLAGRVGGIGRFWLVFAGFGCVWLARLLVVGFLCMFLSGRPGRSGFGLFGLLV